MEFRNELKGILAQHAIGCLMRHAGYPIVPAGVEMRIPTLPLLGHASVASLDLGPEMRLSPDYVTVPVSSPATMIEVKYRRRLTREVLQQLLVTLTEQQRHYPETHTILIRSVSPRGDSARADDLIRVLPPHRLEILAAADVFYNLCGTDEDDRLEPLWQALRPVSAAFCEIQGKRQYLEQLVPLIRNLADL